MVNMKVVCFFKYTSNYNKEKQNNNEPNYVPIDVSINNVNC